LISLDDAQISHYKKWSNARSGEEGNIEENRGLGEGEESAKEDRKRVSRSKYLRFGRGRLGS